MPAVSRRQEKAMYAAAEGKSTLCIPLSVGKEFVMADATAAAAGATVDPLQKIMDQISAKAPRSLPASSRPFKRRMTIEYRERPWPRVLPLLR
jgi:hypothetical protein